MRLPSYVLLAVHVESAVCVQVKAICCCQRLRVRCKLSLLYL